MMMPYWADFPIKRDAARILANDRSPSRLVSIIDFRSAMVDSAFCSQSQEAWRWKPPNPLAETIVALKFKFEAARNAAFAHAHGRVAIRLEKGHAYEARKCSPGLKNDIEDIARLKHAPGDAGWHFRLASHGGPGAPTRFTDIFSRHRPGMRRAQLSGGIYGYNRRRLPPPRLPRRRPGWGCRRRI